MTKTSTNGRVTVALLGQKLDRLMEDVAGIDRKVDCLCRDSARQDELNRSIKHQFWTPEGRSRVEKAESAAEGAMLLVRMALIPVAVAVALGVISLIWR